MYFLLRKLKSYDLYEKWVNQDIKITKTKVKKFKGEPYPSGEEMTLSDQYCRTQDETYSQTFLQYRGSVRIPQLDKKIILKFIAR